MFLSLCTVTLGSFHSGLYRVVVFQIPYCKWLFSRVVYFTNGPSFSISRISISRMAAGDHIFLSISRFYISRIEPVPAKFLKYKSLENFHLYGILHRYLWGIMEWPSSQYRWFCMCQEVVVYSSWWWVHCYSTGIGFSHFECFSSLWMLRVYENCSNPWF